MRGEEGTSFVEVAGGDSEVGFCGGNRRLLLERWVKLQRLGI